MGGELLLTCPPCLPSPFFPPPPPLCLRLAAFPTTAALEPQEGTTQLETQRGQYLRLVCTAASQRPASLAWRLWDRELTRSEPSSPTSLALELPVLKPGDSGRYTCRAENRWGSSQRSLDLAVNCKCGLGLEGLGPCRWLTPPLPPQSGSCALWGSLPPCSCSPSPSRPSRKPDCNACPRKQHRWERGPAARLGATRRGWAAALLMD